MKDSGSPWDGLTHQQVYDCLPPGTLPSGLGSWAHLQVAIQQLLAEIQTHIQEVASAKRRDKKVKKRLAVARCQVKCRAAQREHRNAVQATDMAQSEETFRLAQCSGEYLSLPTKEEC